MSLLELEASVPESSDVSYWEPSSDAINPVLVDYSGLHSLGIRYSKEQLRRLEADGLFPLRVRLSASRVAWLRSEIIDWVSERAQAR